MMETKLEQKRQNGKGKKGKKEKEQGAFPGGPVVTIPPASAGDAGLISTPGRSQVPRGSEACMPHLLSLSAESLCSAAERPQQWEACAPPQEKGPGPPQLEKGSRQQWRPSIATHVNKELFKKETGPIRIWELRQKMCKWIITWKKLNFCNKLYAHKRNSRRRFFP